MTPIPLYPRRRGQNRGLVRISVFVPMRAAILVITKEAGVPVVGSAVHEDVA